MHAEPRRSVASRMHGAELTDEEFERFCGLIYRVAGIRIPDTSG